jgi:hypothetical protein
MDAATYRMLKEKVERSPYADDIRWAEDIHSPESSCAFALECIYVIINSGMKQQIARKIHEKALDAIVAGASVTTVFGHKGKAAAIDHIWKERDRLFDEYCASTDRLEFLESLPWVGPITKYHAAKNFGMDVVKPDRHLVRIAEKSGETPDAMCRRLSRETKDSVAVVDTVIWRAANMGLA